MSAFFEWIDLIPRAINANIVTSSKSLIHNARAGGKGLSAIEPLQSAHEQICRPAVVRILLGRAVKKTYMKEKDGCQR